MNNHREDELTERLREASVTRGLLVADLEAVEAQNEALTAKIAGLTEERDDLRDTVRAMMQTATEEGAKIAGLEGALQAADDALRSYACHGGPSAPCIRTVEQCRTDCGQPAGNALVIVSAALSPKDGMASPAPQ